MTDPGGAASPRTEAGQRAAEALLGFINPTIDPAEIERRSIVWAAFEQGRKFEHRWCPAAQEAPAPVELLMDASNVLRMLSGAGLLSEAEERVNTRLNEWREATPPTPAEPPRPWDPSRETASEVEERFYRAEARPPEGLDTAFGRLTTAVGNYFVVRYRHVHGTGGGATDEKMDATTAEMLDAYQAAAAEYARLSAGGATE
jgi:hypothetical protein